MTTKRRPCGMTTRVSRIVMICVVWVWLSPCVDAAGRGRRGHARVNSPAARNQRELQQLATVHGEPRIETCQTHSDQSQLNSFLWVLRRDVPSFFFGTIHVPHSRVWSYIPENTKEAFYRAEHVYFELDLTDPYTISSLANCQLLPRGQRISDVIPHGLYQRLKQHLDYVRLMMPAWVTSEQRSRGLQPDYLFKAITGNWERKRPVWLMLMVNTLTQTDIGSRGTPVLDLYLAQEAQRLDKTTDAVEEVEEQCAPLNALNSSQVLFALNQTLYQHELSRLGHHAPSTYSTEDLITHYNCGDLDSVLFDHDTAQVPNLLNASLSPHELATAREIDAYFRDELIYKRNQRMADRIQTLLDANPTRSFFFAFGAGHFIGNNTVLDALRVKGHEITHAAPGETLDLGERYLRRRKKFPPLMADMTPEELSQAGGLEHLDPYFDTRIRTRHRHGCGSSSNVNLPGLGSSSSRRRSRPRCPPDAVSPSQSGSDSTGVKYPQFNDLWVRLDTSSFGPDNLFGSFGVTSRPGRVPVYAMYNSGPRQSPSGIRETTTSSLLGLLLVCLLLRDT